MRKDTVFTWKRLAAQVAQQLMADFLTEGAPSDIPKMYGVLVGVDASGQNYEAIRHDQSSTRWTAGCRSHTPLPAGRRTPSDKSARCLHGAFKANAVDMQLCKTQLAQLEPYDARIRQMKADITVAKAKRAEEPSNGRKRKPRDTGTVDPSQQRGQDANRARVESPGDRDLRKPIEDS